jgi:hypothetical protein
MPQIRKYANAAERQAAYRQRCAQGQQFKAISQTPGYRRWNAMKAQALSLLEQIASEMQCYCNQRSDAWQDSERGETFVDQMDTLEQIANELREGASI